MSFVPEIMGVLKCSEIMAVLKCLPVYDSNFDNGKSVNHVTFYSDAESGIFTILRATSVSSCFDSQ